MGVMCRTIGMKLVKLRKDRHCFGCCELFLKGHQLMTYKTTNDEKIYTIYLCNRCQEVVNGFLYSETYNEGELKELWDE